MPEPRPLPQRLSVAQRRARLNRLVRIAEHLGFVGQVEYRHVYSQSVGAQYGLARAPQEDLLIVYAEAFERDADPADFSLEAILAHERGHQLLARHPRLAHRVAGRISPGSQEILASILGGHGLSGRGRSGRAPGQGDRGIAQPGRTAGRSNAPNSGLVESFGAIVVMGPKNLSTIRKELRQALAKIGKDPIQWLDNRIRELERAGKAKPAPTEVLHSLRRILKAPRKAKRPARSASRRQKA